MVVRLISVVLLFALVVNGVVAERSDNICVAPTTPSYLRVAQTESVCNAQDVVTAARAACESAAAGQVCLGAGDVQAAPNGGLVVVGAAVDLDGVDSLTSSGGSLALLKMQADLPQNAQPLQMVLFGDASISSVLTGLQEPFPTVMVKNGPANILNLRDTPSEDGAVVDTMRWNEELTADGRSSDGEWLRLQTDKGAAWVFASLVTIQEGDDANTLYVLDSPVTRHMQSLTLESAADSCGGGLLVQGANDAPAHLEVNGALLSFSTAALLLQAQAGAALTVQVIDGSAEITANGATVEATAGTAVRVALDGSQAAPEMQDSYAFASLASAPLDLLPADVCVVGVNSGTATLYQTPGGQSAGEIDPDSAVAVSGQATVDGAAWWQVGSAWVAQDAVATAGVCAAIPEVAPTTAQQQVSQPAQTTSFAHDLVAEGRSIWQAHTGVDNLSGTCTAPPIAQCDHLAAVTTQPDGTITWLGQEPQPYTLQAGGANTFGFSGRNQLNNANLSLTVTFTSATTWVGTMRLVYDADAGCAHQFNYTAERIR